MLGDEEVPLNAGIYNSQITGGVKKMLSLYR
jgi:hypothetical protein